MVINKSTDFFEHFYSNPRPIILYESKRGAVNIAEAYISFLKKYNIKPSLVVNSNNYKSIQEISELFEEGYILLTAGAERLKKNDIEMLRTLNNNFEIYYDFPFELSVKDIPYLRTYDVENKWYWDMFNSGIQLYDKNPQKYVEGCFSHNGWKIKNGALVMIDYTSAYVNIEDGVRKTRQPTGTVHNNIYILGSCIAYGDRVDDSNTIASLLQKKINLLLGGVYKVWNLGVNNSCIQNSLMILKNINLCDGDFVFYIDAAITVSVDNYRKEDLFIDSLCKMDEICKGANTTFAWLNCPYLISIQSKSNFEIQQEKHRYVNTVSAQQKYIDKITYCGAENFPPYIGSKFRKNKIAMPHTSFANFDTIFSRCISERIIIYDLTKLYNRPHEFIELFTDGYHIGYMGYAFIADFIFKYILNKTEKNVNSEKEYIKLLEIMMQDSELSSYKKRIEAAKENSSDAGAIVMNCNPFTKGHRYLIEKACEMCDYLYIFVVEEDLSEFSFEERFSMITAGTHDIKKIKIIPSGKFIISAMSFPEYFTKEENATSSFDASQDLIYFATQIAPVLNIKKRFVGEEPLDITTNEYNYQMKAILGDYGIEVIEIPRLKVDGAVINATQVRKWMDSEEYDLIKAYVPETTFEVLKQHKKGLLNEKKNKWQ